MTSKKRRGSVKKKAGTGGRGGAKRRPSRGSVKKAGPARKASSAKKPSSAKKASAAKKRGKKRASAAVLVPTPRGKGSLDCVFRPRSIAVIGASRKEGSIGHEIVANIVNHGFTGPVFPVNPKAGSVCSIKCFPDLASIPDPVDLAILVVPAPYVLEAAEACGKKGVRSMVVVTAGFREVGGSGIEREKKLKAIADRHGMRIIGPNCMGVINCEPEIRMNASFANANELAGEVAFVSQSGALGEAILADARRVGLDMSMFASVGNRADVGAADLLEYWEEEEGVKLILLYLEAFGDAQRFKAVAQRLRGKKPIIAVKSGRSDAGARAAGSHTGSVAGSDRGIDTFLQQCGVLRAGSLREMFDYAQALQNQPLPKGNRIAVVTNAGGPGILATDALSGLGFELTELSESTQRKLREVMPEEASAHNPVDLIASADAERYRKVLRIVLKDKSVDSLLVLFVSPMMIDAHAVAEAIVETTKNSGKPAVACVMGKRSEAEALQHLKDGGIPTFRFPEEAASTLAALSRYASLAERPRGKLKTYDVDKLGVRKLLDRHKKNGGSWLSSEDVHSVLESYGFPLIPSISAKSIGEAAEAAHALGYPVVLKARSQYLVHKSDLGGVHVGLDSGDAVLDATTQMKKRLGRRCRDLSFEVQSMAPGHRELLLGLKREPRLGPMIAVGFGGTHVEVLKDVVVRIGPISDTTPKEMLESLRGAPLLDAYRGEPAIDKALVEECVLRLNQLAMDFPEIAEIDLNPFIVDKEGGKSYVVDARILTMP